MTVPPLKRMTSALLATATAISAASAPPMPNRTPANTPAELGAMQGVLQGYDNYDSLESRLAALPLHPVEGIWEFPADGGLVAVERIPNQSPGGGRQRRYAMVLIHSANRALRSGTVLGHLQATARRGVYEASMFTACSLSGTELKSPRKFTIELHDDDTRLVFRPIKKGVQLNLWKMMPYMFRNSVRIIDETPQNLGGCLRLFPAPAIPAEPRYL